MFSTLARVLFAYVIVYVHAADELSETTIGKEASEEPRTGAAQTCEIAGHCKQTDATWSDHTDLQLWSKRCTIPREENITPERFQFLYVGPEQPVIISGASENTEFVAMTNKSALLDDMGQAAIVLSSANAHSYEKRNSVLEVYIENNMDPQSLDMSADSIMYMFGDNYDEGWAEFLAKYNRPPYLNADEIGSISFGMGGDGSGVPFHRHGAVFAEILHGHKRWYLYPKGSPEPPLSHPNQTSQYWTLNNYESLATEELPMECVLGRGEVLYIPDDWWHATLNLGESVFISVFV